MSKRRKRSFASRWLSIYDEAAAQARAEREAASEENSQPEEEAPRPGIGVIIGRVVLWLLALLSLVLLAWFGLWIGELISG